MRTRAGFKTGIQRCSLLKRERSTSMVGERDARTHEGLCRERNHKSSRSTPGWGPWLLISVVSNPPKKGHGREVTRESVTAFVKAIVRKLGLSISAGVLRRKINNIRNNAEDPSSEPVATFRRGFFN
jgi:hypothetical protein